MHTPAILIRITTVPISLKLLLRGQLSFFKAAGFEVFAVSAAGPEVKTLEEEGIHHHVISMTRKISPFKDVISLINLVMLMRRINPHIVHTHTPKAGLLGMMAAWICRVPIRLHTVAGLPLMEKRGLLRSVLVLTEKITYACATRVYPNSKGLQHFIETSIRTRTNLKVVGKGSSNGINTSYFSPNDQLSREAKALRKLHEVKDNEIVFTFIGRIVGDKGINEILSAFEIINRETPCKLFLAGPFENELDPLTEKSEHILSNNKDSIVLGYLEDIRPLLLASDVFVFPSYREGFPNVVMQACCMGCACIVSDINGCNEIIQNGMTGLLVKPKSVDELTKAMLELARDSDRRKSYAKGAQKFVIENFDQQYVWGELYKEYTDLMSAIRNSSLSGIL